MFARCLVGHVQRAVRVQRIHARGAQAHLLHLAHAAIRQLEQIAAAVGGFDHQAHPAEQVGQAVLQRQAEHQADHARADQGRADVQTPHRQHHQHPDDHDRQRAKDVQDRDQVIVDLALRFSRPALAIINDHIL